VKKLTYEFVKQQFEKEGYTLLTKIYKNNQQRLDYICPNRHKHFITWHNWQIGQRCPYCAKRPPINIEFIKKQFKKEGYILLTKIYNNNRQKLEYICPNGHRSSISWSNWGKGHRCPYCAGNAKLDIEFIKLEFEKEGYVLLSTGYEGNRLRLNYVCPEGHKHSISWSNWGKGRRCGICKLFGGSGPQNGCWKGGVSFEPYCPIWKDKEYAEFIKQRDGYKCLNPFCDSKNPDDLTRHHINYNKKDCRKENLITACRSCNTGANSDREWHEAWYKAIMHMRYGYVY
jgi:hypothetical protein